MLVCLTALGLACSTCVQGAQELFVAPNGRDANPGTLAAPFATLERARDAIRGMKQRGPLPAGGVTVMVRAGTYERTETFALDGQDSGTPDAPVVYRAYGNEEVRLVGGKAIAAGAFKAVSDAVALKRLDPSARGKVLAADLEALGITDYGKVPLKYRGAARMSELFFDDQRMPLARWPNEGWATIGKIVKKGSVPRSGDKSNKPGAFQYKGDRGARWAKAKDMWLHGYWCFDWYDEVIKVGSIDTATRTITFAAPHYYGIRQGNPSPRRYRAINLIEELDSPGEYYIDREAGLLYFWPPKALDRARAVLSTLHAPVVTITNAEHVTLRGLTVEACVGTGIRINAGRAHRILACTVRNTGMSGIEVSGGEKHRVDACNIHDTGTQGLVLKGGDRRKLIAAGHEAVNNHIYRFSRRQQTSAYAIRVRGVGNRVAHNLIHDAPHQAIGLGGNDHVIEYNVIHHVCMETDDCGAFYMGRNPSDRGSVIRYNFWHHIGSPMGHGNNAVYFDDGDGGQTVLGNIFFRCGEPGKGNMAAIFCHGGHDNLMENNVFIACKRAIGASPWNDRRWMAQLRGKTYQTRLLHEVDITKPPYTTRYPQLVGFMDYKPGTKRMNRAVRNVSVMCGEFIWGNYEQQDNFVTKEDPGFVDIAGGKFVLRPDSVVFKKIPGFQPIPFEKMGLYQDELRPTVEPEPWDYPAPKPLPHPRPKRLKRRKPPAKKGPAPTFRVGRAQRDVKIDGVIDPTDWRGATGANAMVLQYDYTGHKAKPLSHAWLAYTHECLLIAVDSEVDPKTRLTGSRWGRDDAVEVALRKLPAGKANPIWVLRGYPSGAVQTGTCDVGPDTPKPTEVTGLEFKARVLKPGRWTAEWRIPFASLGIDPARDRKLAFNLTVRKARSGLWLMWEGTRGHSYDADQAGLVELARE